MFRVVLLALSHFKCLPLVSDAKLLLFSFQLFVLLPRLVPKQSLWIRASLPIWCCPTSTHLFWTSHGRKTTPPSPQRTSTTSSRWTTTSFFSLLTTTRTTRSTASELTTSPQDLKVSVPLMFFEWEVSISFKFLTLYLTIHWLYL